MADLIVIMILFVIIGSAIYKLYKDKKNNVMCSGCPSCPSNLSCSKSDMKGSPKTSEPIVFLNKNI